MAQNFLRTNEGKACEDCSLSVLYQNKAKRKHKYNDGFGIGCTTTTSHNLICFNSKYVRGR